MRNQKGFTLIELLIVVAIIGIIAAIAIPSLLRARVSANEAQAIGDTRSVISAEMTYASSNCGFFGQLVELCSMGGDCTTIGIPGYPSTAPDFLGADLGRMDGATKAGFLRNFIEGAAPTVLGPNCDPNSLLDYCYESTPSSPLTGSRSFSGNGSGSLYVDTSAPAAFGACPPAVGGTVQFLE